MLSVEHPSLLGRDAEQRAVAEAIARVAGGDAAVVALFGEAGIGKSALMRETGARAAAAGMRVLEARAAEHERDVPFALAIDALDDAADALGPSRFASLGPDRQAELAAVLPSVTAPEGIEALAGGAEERFRLHRALRALVELLAREKPVALLVDDVHWADAASLELLLHLIRRPPRAPHLLAFAMRPVEPAPRLRDALRTAAAPTFVLSLGPLDRATALELVSSVPDAAQRERIAAEAGGSPLFLHELARVGAGAGELPATILAAVRLEIAALPPGARALLDGAAVAGDPFDPELAAAAADLVDDRMAGLDDLVAADLVRPGDTPRAFRFRHPLVRRAVYDATPPAWRLGAHQRAAEVLAARGAAPVTRAYHVERCATVGDREAAAVLADAAGATVATSPVTAARWYRAALALLPESAPIDERAPLLAPLATALAAAGRIGEAKAVLDEVLALLPAEPSPLRVTLVAGSAALDNLRGHHEAARRTLVAALAELPATIEPGLRAALEVELAACAAFEQDGEETRRWGRAAAEHAEGQPALAAMANAVAATGAVWTGRREEADAALRAAQAALDAAPVFEFAMRPEAFFYLAFAQMFDERYADAIATCRRGVETTLGVGQARVVGALRGLEAMGNHALGFHAAGAELIEAAEDAARLQGSDYALQFTLWMRAATAHERGDVAERRRTIDELREVLARLPGSTSTFTGQANVAAVLLEEDPERCVRELLAVGGERLENVEPTWVTAIALVLVRAFVALGRLDEAERYATLAEEQAARLRLPMTTERARMARAEALLGRGEAAGAVEAARRAVEATAAAGVGREELEARVLAGRALAAAGRRDEAVAALHDAAERAARSGSRLLQGAAARELRKLGARPRAEASAAVGGDPLTDRERAIAELVAGGATNKQAGASLFLSEKTIETHLSRAYAKLGVRSRVELAAIWRDVGGSR